MSFLTEVPLFKRLPRDQHPILASACESEEFGAGEFVIKHGELGSDFFVIHSGEAHVVSADGSIVSTLRPGDHFGEGALLHNEPRTASVQTVGQLVALKITRDKFRALRLNEHLNFGGRKAVAVGGKRPHERRIRGSTAKCAEDVEHIVGALRRNQNLQVLGSLDDERRRQLAAVAWAERVPAGRELITQGDPVADYFYIVKSGGFDFSLVPKRDGDALMRGLPSEVVGSVTSGGSFGELALLYSAPRAATVTATEESVVWVIDRDDFKDILKKVSEQKVHEFVGYLESVEVLRSLTEREKRAVAEAMMEVHFAQGEVVVRQGEPGSIFYVLFEGEASVVKDSVEVMQLRADPQAKFAPYFGERALLNKEPRAATVTITSPTAKAMALDQESFFLLLGPLEDIFRRRAYGSARCTQCWSCLPAVARRPGRYRGSTVIATTREQQARFLAAGSSDRFPSIVERPRIRREDLRRVGLLGCGAFGVVELYEHLPSDTTYAMKALSKGFIVKHGMKEHVATERFILMLTNSTFIIKLHETYNGAQTLYLLLEPALGGEVHTIYIRENMYGSVNHARYYIGAVTYAFEHLHERRIIYRDLKPENLLLNRDGHLKVTDMGLAKFVVGKTFTTCGTPDYFAPELIKTSGHTIAVDWWMLGILLYELMTGGVPFQGNTAIETFKKVLKGIDFVAMPIVMGGALGKLVKAMLKQEPSQRLAMLPGGTDNLKKHEWYTGFGWLALKDLSLPPPHRPRVKHDRDLSNFSVAPSDLPPHIPYVDDGSGWDREFASL